MPIMVRIAGHANIKLVFHRGERPHRIWRGWIHANSSVPVEGHETESRIDGIVDNLQIQTVTLGNRFPIVHSGPAKRIDSQVNPGVANGIHINCVSKVAHICSQVVMPVCRGGG